MASTVRVLGLDGLKRAMAEVPVQMQGKVSLEILRKAAKPIQEAARELAPEETGKLKRNIYVARARDSRPKNPLVVVRVRRRGKAGDRQNAFYWLFQEFGTSHHPAQPFMRPAYESKKQESLDIIRRSGAEEVEKAARKVAKYTARYARR